MVSTPLAYRYKPSANPVPRHLDFTSSPSICTTGIVEKRKLGSSPSPRSATQHSADEYHRAYPDRSGNALDNKPVSTLSIRRKSPLRTEARELRIEVERGVEVRLRGADETAHAIEYGFYKPCACVCCQTSFYCILDADYVICPDCRVVNSAHTEDPLGHHTSGGVGLGFKL